MSIVLLGLPGVGKTTVGAEVALRLGWPFLDFDVEIERREGRTVGEIFRAEGEGYFRALERALTEEVALAPPHVVAPGGGWVTQAGLMALLRPHGSIIHLAASPATLAARLGPMAATRPLLQGGDLLDELAELLARRAAAYAAADHVIDTELLDVQQVIHLVASLAAPCGAG